MTQTHTPTPSCNEILQKITQIEWKQAGNEGEPLILPTLDEIQNFTVDHLATQYANHSAIVVNWYNRYQVAQKNIIEEIVGMNFNDFLQREVNRMLTSFKIIREHVENVGKPVDDLWQEMIERKRQESIDKLPDEWKTALEDRERALLPEYILCESTCEAIGLHIAATEGEPETERLLWLHQTWLRSRETNSTLKHPLAPIIQAWIKEQISKIEPSRRQDTGILHHAIRDTHPSPRLPLKLVETTPAESEQLMSINNLPQIEMQMELPGFVFPESELVPALPMVAYENAGGKPSQQGRGAPISQRLFFNILVEYEQKQRELYRTSRLNTNYRDVKSWLYPNGTTNPKKKIIPSLYKGLYELHNLRFVWERREWNIISVDSLPTMNIKPDDLLTFTVRMPDGMNKGNGALIGIKPLREYGAQSAPKFRAWVRLAYLWDAAKIRNGGKRIYATIPEVLRNSEGYLVDAKGEIILTGNLRSTKEGWKFSNGNIPQRAWYHPLASQTGTLGRNPQADKVPVLSDSDMVKLFYDHTARKREAFRKCLELARKHAMEMQDDGRIVIETDQINEKTGQQGWRLLEPHQGK